MNIVRSDIELEGVKSYFFAPLLKYILGNEEALIQNNDINQFAAFVLGLTAEFPKQSEICDILIGKNPSQDQVVAAIDAMFIFGDEYVANIKQLGDSLSQSGKQHDILHLRVSAGNNAIFENEFSKHVRKSVIGKVQGGQFLKFIQSLLLVKSDSDKLDAFSSLCVSDYDWDAYVFLKLFANNLPEKKEEIEAIRDNIIDKLKSKHAQLVDLWLNGPKIDPRVELARNLKQPISVAIESVLPTIVDNILPLIAREDDTALVELAPVTGQLFQIIVRAILAGERDLVKQIHSKIPESIRRVMFPGLIRTVVKTSITLVSYFTQFFIPTLNNNRLTIEDASHSGVYNDLNEPWKRDALLKVIIDYKAAVERDVFGFPVDLANGQEVSSVLTAFDFLIEVVKNFDSEMCFAWLNSEKKNLIISSLKEENVSYEPAKAHLNRIIAALESDTNLFIAQSPPSAKTPEVADPTPDNYNYTKEAMQKLHIQDVNNFPSAQVLNGIQQPQLVVQPTFVDIGHGVRVGSKDVEINVEIGRDEIDFVVEQTENVPTNEVDRSGLEAQKTTVSQIDLTADSFEQKVQSSLDKQPELQTPIISENNQELENVQDTQSHGDTISEPTVVTAQTTISPHVENITPPNPVEQPVSQPQFNVNGAGDSAVLSRPTSKFQTGGFANAPSSKFGRSGGFGQGNTVPGFGGQQGGNAGGQGGGNPGYGGQQRPQQYNTRGGYGGGGGQRPNFQNNGGGYGNRGGRS